MSNKLVIYGGIALASYFVYITQGPSTNLLSTGRQDYDKIIVVDSKDLYEQSITTNQGDYLPKNLDMYTEMEQGCKYKIWTTGNSIDEIEHMIDDGCTNYLPDSLHKF